jgi:predicted peptidase
MFDRSARAVDLPHYRCDLRPSGSDSDERPPLIVFLHGAGERGDELALVRRHGPPSIAPRYGLDRFLILSPQCPADAQWSAIHLDEFIRAAIARLSVDADRVYLTGISMGAFGGWEIAMRSPELFAAAALVCGGGDPAGASRLSTVPVWLVHSAADAAVSPGYSDRLFDALRHHDAEVTYTRFRSLGHVETWQHFYGSRMLYDWFLECRRRAD